jgi:hypothetical protein
MRHFTFRPEDLDAIRHDRYHHPQGKREKGVRFIY